MARTRRRPAVAGTCSVCTAPTPPGDELCRTHDAALLKTLRDLLPAGEGWLGHLDETRLRHDRAAVQEGARPGGERGLVWNEAAADAHFVMTGTLNAWALDVAELAEDPRDQLLDVDGTDAAATTAWLLRNAHTLRRLPAAAQAYDELDTAAALVRRTVDLPSVSSSFTVGPCPERGDDDGPCPGQVRAIVISHAKREPLDTARSWLLCTSDDRHRWDETRWASAGRRIRARGRALAVVEEAARAPLPDPFATCPRCDCAGNHGVRMTHFRAPRLPGRTPEEEIVVTMAQDPPDGTPQVERTCAFCGHQWRTAA